MANEDNVRLLRYLYLLGDGGSLALREIIMRETSSRSQPLEQLLSENKFRFREMSGLQVLFPSSRNKINTNIEDWSIDILYQVIKTLFWLSLSSSERSAINTLHSNRVDLDSQTGLMENFYIILRGDLRRAINDIIQGLDDNRRQRLRDIVNRSAAEDLNMQATLNIIRKLNEFPDEMMNSLERRFGELDYPCSDRIPNEPYGAFGVISKNIEATEWSETLYQRNVAKTMEISDTERQNLQMIELSITQKSSSSEDTGEITIPLPNIVGLELLKVHDNSLIEVNSEETDTKTANLGNREIETTTQDVRNTHYVSTIQSTGDVDNENGRTLQSISPSNGEDRVNEILDRLQELRQMESSHNERRSEFWQSIDTKIQIESDSALHAATSQTEFIQAVNGIIRSTNLPEARGNMGNLPNIAAILSEATDSPQPLQEIEPRGELNFSMQAIREQQSNASNTHTIETHFLPEENLLSLQTRSNLHILPMINMHVAEGTHELVENVSSLLIDIYRLGNEGEVHIMGAGEGCVEFMIRCRTYGGISNFLQFIKGERFEMLLQRISMALERQLGNPVTMHPYIPEESLRNLEEFIAAEFERMPKRISLSLRLQYRGINEISSLKRYLESDKAKEKLRNIALDLTTLSTGSTHSLSAVIDAKQLKLALENRSDRLLYSTKS